MNEEKIASIMRELIESLETADVEKSLSFFAEDGVWLTLTAPSKARRS